jgi:dihydrofolate reductase
LVVIGGAKTYELFLPYITEFYVTHVKGEYDGDTFMPPFEHLFDKQEVIREFECVHKVLKYYKTV